MSSVILKTLYDLKTLHQETMMVLMRYYLEIDHEIPSIYLPILLGEKPFPVEHAPKDAPEKWARVLFSVLMSSMPKKGQAAFVYRKDGGGYFIPTSTVAALNEFIEHNSPLEAGMLMPLKQWRESEEYLVRFGDWDD